MYTATCSSCSHVEKSSFARVGAVMVCPACKATVQLRVEDVKRQVKLRTEGDDDLFKPPQPQQVQVEDPAAAMAAAAAAAATNVAADGPPEFEEHEDHAQLAAEATRRTEAVRKRKPKAQAISRAGLTGGELAQHLAQKRKSKTMMVVGITSAAAIVGLVLLISAMGGGNNATQDASKDRDLVSNPDPSTNPSNPANKDSAKNTNKDGTAGKSDPLKDKTIALKDGGKPATDPTKDKTNPLPAAPLRIDAMPLGIDSWQTVNEPFRHNGGSDRVLLINDQQKKDDNGGYVFKADVVSQGIASAVVSVALVNDEDRIYARFERPYFLVDGKTPRPVHLTIPPELWSSSSTICWQVMPIDTHVTNLTLLEDTLAEPLRDQQNPVIKVSAYNSSSFQLKDAAFVIQGLDAAGQVLSQWRLKIPREVDARSWVKFEAQLPDVKMDKFNSWRVHGAGLPSGSEVAPPVIEHQPDPKERDPREPVIPKRGRGLFDF